MELTANQITAAIEQWLERTTTEERRDIMTAELRRHQLLDHHIAGNFVEFFPLPYIMPVVQFNAIKQRSEQIVHSLIRMERHAYRHTDEALYRRLLVSLTPGGRRLVKQSSYESDFSLERRFRRIDGFGDQSGQYQIVEVNQAAPLSSSRHDNVITISAGILKQAGIPWTPPLMVPALVQWFVDEYQHRYRTDALPHRIAVPVEHGYPGKFSDLPAVARMIRSYAKDKWGHELVLEVCTPWDIRLVDGQITLYGQPCDLIWRNTVYMDEYRRLGIDLTDYEKICSQPDKFLIINAGRSWITRTKEALAILWDDDYCDALDLSASDRAELRQSIPETRNLKYQPQYRKAIISERKDWISKPTDSSFGQGIEFGANHTSASWEAIVKARATDGFVFQRLATPPRLSMRQLTFAGELTDITIAHDICPYHVNGVVAGPMLMRATRIGAKSTTVMRTMNLAPGGALIPVLIAD